MSYTTLRQPQGVPVSYVNLIREALIAELVAINDYYKQIVSTDIKELKEILQHIMEEEKRHYGMFLQLIRKYDPEQYGKYIEADKDVKISTNIKLSNHDSKMQNQIILNNIRDDIKSELEAVVLYEQHISMIPINEIRDVFKEVTADEKEHIEELTSVLLKLDKDSYGPISK
ncbi:ferritin family protein [Clostridium amazonitimonense]|uniref:ferritin family protein n=1 Tax=Clostridium amazonitimonense TaxID=1499689 RepID=UPI0005093B13|nr:ferritin-like domain-containing protein [Clostridium amazonitimonense]